MGADNLPDEVTEDQATPVDNAGEPCAEQTGGWIERMGRTVYTYMFTAIFTGIIVGANFTGSHDVIAEKTVEGMSGLIELLIISFLFAKTLDRSQLLNNIGVGMRNRRMGRPDGPQG